jgi:hypothetical protein
VFLRKIQSAINEGCLVLHEKQGDKHRFPINTMELQQPKVVWPHQVEATKGENVVVREAKSDLRGKELTREVAYEKTFDGRETLKITIKASELGGQGSSTSVSRQPLEPEKAGAVKPAGVGGQTAPAHGRPKMSIPNRSEIGNWKLNVAKNQGSVPKPKVTFDMLFDKYSKQKAVTSGHPRIKRGRHHLPGQLSMGESSQRQHFTPAWTPSSSNSPRPIYDDNGVMWVSYQQSFHPRRGGSRRPALDHISRPTQDHWTPCQSRQGH